MSRKNLSMNKLFYNNKFVLVISVLAALGLWTAMVMMDTQDHPHAITGVPVVITLSDAAQTDGLKVFSPIGAKATVYITGNSLVVNQVKATDMQVVAQPAASITTPGTYPITLSVQKMGNLTDFNVTSISPGQAIISVDRYKEKTFTIPNTPSYKEGYQADPAFFVGIPTLSSDTVTISGPERLVQQVNRVACDYQVSDTLRDTKQFTANLVMYDANGNKISDSDLKMSPDSVDVTIPVQPRKVLPLAATFTNNPDGLTLGPSQVNITPQSIEVAGPADVMQTLSNVTLDPIDFSEVSPTNNVFDVNVDLPATCKNLSNIPTAKVTLNLNGMATRSLTVTSFTVQNLPADKTSTVYTQNLPITVVGPDSEISKITENNIIATINMSGKENFTGHTEMPVTFSISSTSSSWVYGTYMATIGVTAKATG